MSQSKTTPKKPKKKKLFVPPITNDLFRIQKNSKDSVKNKSSKTNRNSRDGSADKGTCHKV